MNQSESVAKYVAALAEKYATGQAREHTYRSALEGLIADIGVKARSLNEPKHSEFGAPDFVFTRGEIQLGYAETKDVDVDINKMERSEQLQRYISGYTNFILTNYIEFRFYQNGQRYEEPIVIASIQNGRIVGNSENYDTLANALINFLSGKPEPIKNGALLAKIMGGKARRIRDNVRHIFSSNIDDYGEIKRVYEIVKKLLVHDLTPDTFADMYAQTLVYGLFVARYYDESSEPFTRQKARELVPASNPLLRHFFDHIIGPDFDKRLGYIVNELCEVFSLTDVRALMEQYYKQKDLFGKIHEGLDPVIHFYEDFLKEYDAELRKKMGAYYTPLLVVRFIVRSVDELLKKEFNLPQGLADTAKAGAVHKVQILDPAVGTGTFLSETVQNIHDKFSNQQGRWPAYVLHDLLPRIYGFELMMAPYVIAHLKIGMMLKETGFKYFNNARLNVFLTNSLEESSVQPDLLSFGFAESIAEEAKEAAVIKNDRPIMVVLGNPPYSISSSNKGEWILNLIKDYKKGLGERKINLDDDYIKFIRFAEHFIEKNKTGIVAMITNNSFIDGITHRQMRKHLLETFDAVYILDLHGNARKKEANDENVFSIQQGVSINIFVRKNADKKKLGTVYHSELFGKREEKFETLNASDIQKIKWQKLDYSEPYYFFVPKNFRAKSEYDEGFKIDELFLHYNSGIQTKRDDTVIQFSLDSIEKVADDFKKLTEKEVQDKYQLPEDGRDWKIKWAQDDLRKGYSVEQIQYRPFDVRYTIYTGNSKGFIAYPREKTNINIVKKENLSLLSSRTIPANQLFDRVFVTRSISDIHAASDQTYIFPFYTFTNDVRILNLKTEIVAEIEKIAGKVTPEDIFDYIYAVLHSPKYREKYKEFLKIDFPRVPYPKDKKQFQALVALGCELRGLHLLESPKVNQFITDYNIAGTNKIEKVEYKDGKAYINATQYFDNVPEIAWNFWIGGYQPAQKWLKDRKCRELIDEDLRHYQQMIVALVETDRIMREIDKIWNF
ncbi:MAG: adenine-specific DNA methyltransferase [Parcubacteria group bacterium Licking1014_17]|nr:MAG: adenine-specific DNA methyltransferase [Parcubacteria group bacterium Licking1014_17]